MVNQKLMEGEVGRLMEGGYSNAEGGTATVRTPDASVSRRMFPPIASRPATLANVAVCSCPTLVGAVWPSISARISPLALIVIPTASDGMVIAGTIV